MTAKTSLEEISDICGFGPSKVHKVHCALNWHITNHTHFQPFVIDAAILTVITSIETPGMPQLEKYCFAIGKLSNPICAKVHETDPLSCYLLLLDLVKGLACDLVKGLACETIVENHKV